MKTNRNIYFQKAKRIVIKIGSGVLTTDKGLNIDFIRDIVCEICTLIDNNKEIIIVSSGAVASGMKKLRLKKKPEKMPEKQAAASVGQAGLILEYEKEFKRYSKIVSQILLTRDDLSDRKRYLNASNTLNTLLSWSVVPIINENDTVVTEEIRFGDNDNLSALISLLLDADLLINLTDIDGLYSSDPGIDQNAELITTIEKVTDEVEKRAGKSPGAVGTGGMLTKILAAGKVTASGIPMIIAGGKYKNILTRLFSGEITGTFFVPQTEKLNQKKRWLAFGSAPNGSIIIDEGAKNALIKNGTSLLSTGIISVSGKFDQGDTVEIKDSLNNVIAIGLTNYSCEDTNRIKGIKSQNIKDVLGYKEYDEVIHRNYLALLSPEL
jgi:glutamate 5-kinase